MLINRSWLLRGSAGLLALLVVWIALEFSPDRQLDKVFSRLIRAAENRNWKTVSTLMADDYHDQWGMNREQAVQAGSDVLGHFLALQILCEDVHGTREGREAVIETRLRLRGRGNAIGEAVMQQANALENHFQFAWRRISWKPWDWKLVSISQNEIEFDPKELP